MDSSQSGSGRSQYGSHGGYAYSAHETESCVISFRQDTENARGHGTEHFFAYFDVQIILNATLFRGQRKVMYVTRLSESVIQIFQIRYSDSDSQIRIVLYGNSCEYP